MDSSPPSPEEETSGKSRELTLLREISREIRGLDGKLDVIIRAGTHMDELPGKFEECLANGANRMSEKIIMALDQRSYNSIPTKVLWIVIFATIFGVAGGSGLKVITDTLRMYLKLPL